MTPEQQEQFYRQTMNIAAARARQEEREMQMIHMAMQQNEILLGVLAEVSGPEAPNLDYLRDLVFSTNDLVRRQEGAWDAGIRVAELDGEFPEFPDDLPDPDVVD